MKFIVRFKVILGLLMIFSSVIFAQPTSESFVIIKSTIDGGGGTSSGGDFVLRGNPMQTPIGHLARASSWRAGSGPRLLY